MGEEWVVSYLCFSCSKLTVRVGPCRVSLSARLPPGSPHSTLLSSVSDYVIDDKVAILQKRDHEGFGFVLRGAKGNGSQSHEEGTALLVMSSMPCPFLPFLKPPCPCPVVVCLDLECPRTRPQVPLCCFPFSCGESYRVEIYLVRANGGLHRGMNTGLGIPICCPPHPRFLCPSSQVPRAGRGCLVELSRAMPMSALSLPLPAAETPIEEFTPTPAFPALQYLESVDVEGVAWRAGLRTGDFLIEVRPPPSCPCPAGGEGVPIS